MAKSLSQALSRTVGARLLPLRNRSTSPEPPTIYHVYKVDPDSDADGASRRMEDVVHCIIAKRSQPNWISFRPLFQLGSSQHQILPPACVSTKLPNSVHDHFFKGKVTVDHSHKWIHKNADEQEINFLSAWHNSVDSHSRTWEAHFRSGIKTIALIAVREGVVQLGAMQKASEDLNYVVMLRRKFSLIESIPGVLLPHPSSSAIPEMWQQHQGNNMIESIPFQLYLS